MNISIEKIVYPGKALGRGADGIATFTDNALPGETVDVVISKSKKTYKEAKLVSIVQPSTFRIRPRCPSFGKCGGCSFQHTDYLHQLDIKKSYVQEILSPYCSCIQPIIPSPESWNYRNKMEFSFFTGDTGKIMIGLHEKQSYNKHLSVPPCFIADESFLPLVDTIAKFAQQTNLPIYNPLTHQGFWRHLVLRKGKRTGEILINIVTNKQENIHKDLFDPLVSHIHNQVSSTYWTINSKLSDIVQADELILLDGKTCIEEELIIAKQHYFFLLSPFSFFQTNSRGTEKLYETILDFINPAQTEHILDLYCGTGTIGLILAPYVQTVTGIEQVHESILNAEENKKRNTIANIVFESSRVEQWIKQHENIHFDSIVVDPPRNGLSMKVIDFVLAINPKKLIYVSCNPATLARDLQILQTGGYKAQKIQPIDMFPQTYHVETVTLLTL